MRRWRRTENNINEEEGKTIEMRRRRENSGILGSENLYKCATF